MVTVAFFQSVALFYYRLPLTSSALDGFVVVVVVVVVVVAQRPTDTSMG
jgi:hypothetical protein